MFIIYSFYICPLYYREIMRDMAQVEYRRTKRTLFGNECEKMERDVSRTRRILRSRVDKIALRNRVGIKNGEEKVAAHKRYLEALSRKAPDFIIPLRSHTVWEGMRVVFTSQFACAFSPTWVTEGETLTLQCIFTCPLLPFQQDVTWYRDGVQLEPSKTVAMKTDSDLATLTLEPMHKEHEGLYTVQLRTRSGTQEHSAFVYVKDAAATVPGGPASPLAVQVSDINKDYVFLTWQPPSADGSSPVEGYYVEKYVIEEQWTRCNAQIQKVCHFPVFGLKPGAYYQFRVCAVNKAGVGRPSKPTEPILTMDPQEADRKMGDVTAPFPPTNVHVCEGTDTYLVLSWSPPEPRGREPLTYHVERVTGTNNWERASLDMVVSSPRFPVFDLVKGRKYCFRVRAVNKYGVSDPSAPSAPVSLRKPQGDCVGLIPPSPPHSLMPLRDTDTSVQLKWQEPEDKEDILGYYLYYSETGKQNWKTINNKPYTKTSFTVHGLKTGKEYVFRAKSVSRAGNSIYSEESPPITVKAAIRVPSAPSAIVLLLCTDSEMVVGWRAPAHSGGAPVRGYYLDKKEEGAEMWREVNEKAVPERKLKVSNLTSGNFYQFRVFAANMVGVGKPSEPSEPFLCEKWTMPEPGCPYDVQIKEIRDTSLVAVWAAPLYEGQGPIIGYILEVCQGDQSDEWTAINDQPISSTHYKCKMCDFLLAVIGLKTGWQVEVSEEGRVRLWLQTESLSDAAELRLILNDQEIHSTPHRTITLDKAKGLVEIVFDPLSPEDQGSYTAQLRDGKAKNQFTLYHVILYMYPVFCFSGPHFEEYLSWSVTDECVLVIKCKKSIFEKTPALFPCRDKPIDQTRTRPGYSTQKVWIDVFNPTEKDQGKYTLEMFDGKETHKRHLNLSGQGKGGRAHVIKGLPDVVAIMEGKTLCLTCFVDGDPYPDIFWLRNDKRIASQGQFDITKEHKCTTITINNVTMQDSGKYSIFVENKYGSETVDVTVSVYKHGDKPPAHAVLMG
uniref:Uncharacterized protein n=1 Tax=Periophthalmus magnuspinnatus TaxID=409849 RepID=A0A3B3Z994_9GOBI